MKSVNPSGAEGGRSWHPYSDEKQRKGEKKKRKRKRDGAVLSEPRAGVAASVL